MRRALALCALGAAAVAAAGLADPPILGGSALSLDGDWAVASSDGRRLTGRVPGDILTDLQAAGAIGDPYYEVNFLTQKEVYANQTRGWTYTKTFDVAAPASGGAHQHTLVFDGIKMAAAISLNGAPLGRTNNQFLRYTFDATPAIQAGTNTLEVVFDWGKTDGRFMACTGGWDWAPYTTSYDAVGTNTMSFGLWKSVYLITQAPTAAPVLVEHVVVHTFYEGEYAGAPLTDDTFDQFRVDVTLHLNAAAAVADATTFALDAEWGAAAKAEIASIPTGRSTQKLSVRARAGEVKLWWPNGMGAQPLYTVTTTLSGGGWPAITTTRRVGFRTTALVTGNETEDGYAEKYKGVDGTTGVGMYFRVNGAVVFNRGANMIPMEEMEGRQTAEAFRILVNSAADANMNTLRIWGGGIFYPEEFYDACDERGILLYHDMMYAQSGHAPAETDAQDAELRYQVRRLSPHPCILLWDGCNECKVIVGTKTGIYATFVLRVVVDEDKSRIVWPSCPADGWQHGVDRLTGLPNGSPNGLIPHPENLGIETHGPYQHSLSSIFQYVNVGGFNNKSSVLPLPIAEYATGIGAKSVFASEFGAVTLTSFESLSPLIDPSHWALHGGMPMGSCVGTAAADNHNSCEGLNPMQQRNYGCDSGILRYFGYKHITNAALNTTGAAPFKKGLYLCMLQQALDIKQNIEVRRSQSQHGIIVWQLNEIWPTGGWGSVEYGGVGQPGIVRGGRWKPLQYIYKRTLYQDVIAACGREGACYLKNDAVDGAAGVFTGAVCVDAVSLATGERDTVGCTAPLRVPGGGGSAYWTLPQAAFGAIDATTHLLAVRPEGAAEENLSFLSFPGDWKLNSGVTVTAAAAATANADGSIDVTITADGVALYVVLTTLAEGRFSDNAFCMFGEASRAVRFIPFVDGQAAALAGSLRVEHLAQYIA